MQNKEFVCGIRYTGKTKSPEISQVIFHYYAQPEGSAINGYAAFNK